MGVSVLDCTLRDGGYVNNFKFGMHRIKAIINLLSASGVDIVECGFMKTGKTDPECTLYSSIGVANDYITCKSNDTLYVAMIAYGDISDEEIEPCDQSGICGIRLTFHKDQIQEAINLGYSLIKKGYKLFMQPVGTISYSDYEFLQLVEKINNMKPYAFYIVDTMGTLYKNELLHLFYMADKNLEKNIKIGYHSHNNLQLAFSNAQALTELITKRDIILDSSVYGMGRGAGNLCTELITQYLNDNVCHKYDVISIMEIFDKYINDIYQTFPWGYAIPFFIASSNTCHPNYAQYLIEKQSLSMKQINSILTSIPPDEKHIFNRRLIEKLYLNFKKIYVDDSYCIKKLKKMISNRPVLVIAPGRTILDNTNKINIMARNINPFIISINFFFGKSPTDAVFISNTKRLENIALSSKYFIIATSNLKNELVSPDTFFVNYYDLVNSSESESDNAGVMAIKLLCRLGIKDIYLAGFDGYDRFSDENYIQGLEGGIDVKSHLMEEKNRSIQNQINELKLKANIHFVTPSKYDEDNISKQRANVNL